MRYVNLLLTLTLTLTLTLRWQFFDDGQVSCGGGGKCSGTTGLAGGGAMNRSRRGQLQSIVRFSACTHRL